MTDTQKIIEEQINQAWARGTNWAMQGRGYALDSNADTQAEVLIELYKNIQEEAKIEERERVVGEIGKKLEKINDYPLHNEFVKGETEAYKNVLSFLDKPLTDKERII